MNETMRIAQFVAETDFQDLPSDLVDKAKIFVLDNLASGFVGAEQPWSKKVASLANELGGNSEATVFNQRFKLDVSRASLVNGAMIGAFEVEHVGHSAHPGGTAFPAALAFAERERLDGRSFILAMMLGYEVTCRVGAAQTRATEDERGFHNPGVNGPFGAAAAVAKLMGLDQETTAWALGIAGSHSAGLTEFAFEGAMTKRLHLGRAAQMGLESALLARKGFTGPTTVFEGRHGYLNAVSPSPQPAKLTDGLGQEWISNDLAIKAYPCHVTGQAIVHAIQGLKERMAFSLSDIGKVSIAGGSRIVSPRHAEREPTNMLGGQYSLPFTVAVALARDISSPVAFDEAALVDPEIRTLAKRIEVSEELALSGLESEITLVIKGEGHTLFGNGFPGSLEYPLDYESVAEKFRRYTEPLIDEPRVGRIIDLVRRLDGIEDMSELAGLIA